MEKRTMMNRKQPANSRRRSVWRDSRGAVMVEYALLLSFVAVPIVIGLTAGGKVMLTLYKNSRDYTLLPTP